MGDRYWLWLVARLLVAIVIVAWFASYLRPGGGEKEFQKALDALKNVHSFRVAFTGDPVSTQHTDMLWEVDCANDAMHHQMNLVQTSPQGRNEMTQEDYRVAGLSYLRQPDGSWSQDRYASGSGSAKAFCQSLANGADGGLFPQISTVIRRGIIQKGDKKIVNGIRCREWLVTMKGGYSGLEHDTVCLGLDDHLPYEMTVDYDHSRSTYSDYNSPLRIDLPQAILQLANTTTGSN